MSVSIQDARQRAEELIATVQDRALALASGEGLVAVNLRRVIASEPFIVAKGAVDRAVERVGAVDLDAYVAQLVGYKTQAEEAVTAQWQGFSATPAGRKAQAAWGRVLAFAEQFFEMP
jgi:hypothetical protein